MSLLALDTASDACSAALSVDGELLARRIVRPRAHASLLLPMVRSLLEEAGCGLSALSAIAFGRGPGAFTGLRIAAGVAQGLAFGAGLGVIPVSDLAALAQGAIARDGARHVAVAVDARMDEVYWGLYRDRDGLAVEVEPERVCAPEDARVPAGPAPVGIGTGWNACGDRLRRACPGMGTVLDAGRLPDAADMLPLAAAALERGGALPPEQAVPVYLRDDVARKRSARGDPAGR